MTFKKSLYICQVWSSSTNLKDLKSWVLVLPYYCKVTGLSTNKKRFTLIRSPLGNKKSKDQFERREYKNYFSINTNNPSQILFFLSLLKLSSGVKLKVNLRF
ncbi:unnamed protein product [Ectocarpus sp. 4 AP-2014]